MKLMRAFFHLALILPSLAAGALDNRLADQTSPYLRAHANDPVHWQPLDQDAMAAATALQRPLFVAVGYLACQWCYAVHRESYSDVQIASVLNQNFIPVLVDRELNPAVDRRLMDFINRTRGYAGWPLHVWLTPDGYPVAGFSYQNRDGFFSALTGFMQRWKNESEHITQLARRAESNYQLQAEAEQQPLRNTNLQELLQSLLQQTAAASDIRSGGFGSGNKFPSVPQLNALLNLYAVIKDDALAEFLHKTLQAMRNGGLHDHLGGGFYRYTTDPEWRTPHYEKMLYTNALLAGLYTRAAHILNYPDYKVIALSTINFMLDEMWHTQGGFVASLSALDTQGREGGYYQFNEDELKRLLNDDERAQLKLALIGDPHRMIDIPDIPKSGDAIRHRLLAHRRSRTLIRDEKRLIGWNALALQAMSGVYAELSPTAKHKVRQLADLLLAQARNAEPLKYSLDGNTVADFATYMHLAHALRSWEDASDDIRPGPLVDHLLQASLSQFRGDAGWLTTAPAPLVPRKPRRSLQDEETPSPSALWIRLTQTMEKNAESGLDEAARAIALDWPKAMLDNAFFYATQIVDLVIRQANKSKQQELKNNHG